MGCKHEYVKLDIWGMYSCTNCMKNFYYTDVVKDLQDRIKKIERAKSKIKELSSVSLGEQQYLKSFPEVDQRRKQIYEIAKGETE